MRFFKLLNLQHVILYIFPALIFLILFGVALSFSHLRSEKGREKRPEPVTRFADGIIKGNKPFPLIMILIIIGTVIWAFFYILMYAVSEVRL